MKKIDVEPAANKDEIVVYQPEGAEFHIAVRVENETVWLTQAQMAELFHATKQNISHHVAKIFKEGELDPKVVVKEYLTTTQHGAISGKTQIHAVKNYNLDVIISVGYRIKSIQGTRFRQWALNVLKEYMLKGYAIEPSRVLVTHENYLDLVNVVNRIDSTQTDLIDRVEKLEDKYPELGMRIFFRSQLYDASSCIEGILEQAEREILLIDGYVDRRTLDMLSRKRKGVSVLLYTSSKGNGITGKETGDFNAQYPSLEVHVTDEFHDRFLILDRRRMYHIGASLKDAGRKTFEISENNDRRYLDMILERLGLPAWDKV